MTEPSQKIVLPAYLIRRLEAFRIAKGGEQSYILRDKLYGKTYDFDPWQFFVLEVLPGCETLDKLQSVFRDRFGREIGQDELEILFASIADQKLFDESALQHPLLEQEHRVDRQARSRRGDAYRHARAPAPGRQQRLLDRLRGPYHLEGEVDAPGSA